MCGSLASTKKADRLTPQVKSQKSRLFFCVKSSNLGIREKSDAAAMYFRLQQIQTGNLTLYFEALPVV